MAAAASGGGSSTSTGSGGGSSSGGGGTAVLHVLEYEDVKWDRDKHGDRVQLGRGAFGNVYAGVLHGQPVAIKAETLERSRDVENWEKTASMHYTASCTTIVRMHGIIVDRHDAGTTHYTVMERLAGTMTALLLKPGGVYHSAAMHLRLQLLADVAGGLAYLHSREIIHGNVQPDNVLLTAVTPRPPLPTAKLSDFFSSVWQGDDPEKLEGERGTPMYMDPVLLDRSARITAASDVYSFGIMAWQVLSGLQPYEAERVATAAANMVEAVEMLKSHVCGPGGARPPLAALVERGVPPVVVRLVEACWAPAQRDRPTMAAVHRFLEAAAAAAVGAGVGASGGSGGGVGGPAALHAAPATAPLPPAASAPAPTPAPAPAPVVPPAPAPVRPATPDPEAPAAAAPLVHE